MSQEEPGYAPTKGKRFVVTVEVRGDAPYDSLSKTTIKDLQSGLAIEDIEFNEIDCLWRLLTDIRTLLVSDNLICA